jgi:hypothetical protein
MTQVDHYMAQRSYTAARKPASHRMERIEMRGLVWLTYPLFLAVAALSRLGLTRSRFAAVVSERPVSVFAEARQTAEATILSAFRG